MLAPQDGVGVDIIAPIQDALRDRGVFLVGGQAVWVWAELYLERAPELEKYRPFTSLDYDFFGPKEKAALIAKDLGGEILLPEPFSDPVNSAIVYFEHDGERVQIDFINNVLGIQTRELIKHVDLLEFSYTINGNPKVLSVPLMTPLPCLMSRVANRLGPLQRKDSRGMSQLQVSPIVLREYVLEALGNGYPEQRQVHRIARCLHWYLRRDHHGRKAHTVLEYDPLQILILLNEDERVDARFKKHQISYYITDVQRARSRMGLLVEE